MLMLIENQASSRCCKKLDIKMFVSKGIHGPYDFSFSKKRMMINETSEAFTRARVLSQSLPAPTSRPYTLQMF